MSAHLEYIAIAIQPITAVRTKPCISKMVTLQEKEKTDFTLLYFNASQWNPTYFQDISGYFIFFLLIVKHNRDFQIMSKNENSKRGDWGSWTIEAVLRFLTLAESIVSTFYKLKSPSQNVDVPDVSHSHSHSQFNIDMNLVLTVNRREPYTPITYYTSYPFSAQVGDGKGRNVGQFA